MPARRSPGEGSVSYVASRSRWMAQLTLPTGKRKTVGYATTEREARRLLEAAKRDVKALTVESSRLTVEQFLTGWLEEQRGQLALSWWVRVESMIRLHIGPELGHLRLSQLEPRHLAGFYRAKRQTLSGQTVHHLHAILHRALGQALRWGYVARNVAELVDAPKVERQPPKVLEQDEATRLLAALRGDRYWALWLLALATGMREGELLALRWADVDLDAGAVMVRRNVGRVWKQGLVEGITKTRKPHRILLPGIAVAALLDWRRERGEPASDTLVFPNGRGNVLEVSNLRTRHWLPLLERAGIGAMKVHELRHGAATLLMLLNVHPQVVSEMLGHADPAMALRVYGHVLAPTTGAAVGEYGRLLERLSHAVSHAKEAIPDAGEGDS